MTATDKRQCKGTNGEGEPCQTPIVQSNGWCRAHDPSPEAIARRAEASLRGGVTTTKLKKQQEGGLTDEELPPITSAQVAEQWAETIGRAAATGRISASAAGAALRALSEWRAANQAGRLSSRLAALTDALAEWRKSGDPAPVLKLVEGGK